MEYFKPVFTRKTFFYIRTTIAAHHPKISFWHFYTPAPQAECAVAFPAVCCLRFAGNFHHPLLQVGKSGVPSLLCLLPAWPVYSVHPGLQFQDVQLGQNWWHGCFHLQDCGWRQANNEHLGYNTISSQYSPAWTRMDVHSLAYTSKIVFLLTHLLPVPRTELRSVALHLLSFFPFLASYLCGVFASINQKMTVKYQEILDLDLT